MTNGTLLIVAGFLFGVASWVGILVLTSNQDKVAPHPTPHGIQPSKVIELDDLYSEVWCYEAAPLKTTALIVNSRHAVLAVSENSAFCTAR